MSSHHAAMQHYHHHSQQSQTHLHSGAPHHESSLSHAAAVTAALIAFSRIYLYVHYPTDIIGGTLLGLLIGFVTVKISESEKMRQMFRKKP